MKHVATRAIVWGGLLAALASLTGCGGGDFDDLQARIEEMRSAPRGRIEPPPEFKSYKSFSYSAAMLRSPFQKPLSIEEKKDEEESKSALAPDESRPKELLEEFSIESLQLVGSLMRPGQTFYALVRDPKGGIHRVSVGNYMGRNYGRVTAVEANKVELVETVPNGDKGWVERPRTIALQEK